MSFSQEQLNQLREQAQTFQEQMADIQTVLGRTEVTGIASDGAVAVSMTASGDFLSVHLDPVLVQESSAGELEELLLAALRDAAAQLRERAQERAGSLSAMLDSLR